MTSDRHLALMDLMREIGEPTKAYQRSVRLAAALGSNTPQWDSAVDKGKAALDLIEQSVRAWVAAHPEPGALSDLERARSIAVALEQENAKLTEELAEVKAANDPRLRGLLVKAAPDKDLYVQWSTVCDMPGGVFSRETALDYGFPVRRSTTPTNTAAAPALATALGMTRAGSPSSAAGCAGTGSGTTPSST